MKVLIAGGRGFLGAALARGLSATGHDVSVLTRGVATGPNEIGWDGRTENGWTALLNETDVVVNATGYGLEHWPWTSAVKRRFADSRIIPGRILARAIEKTSRRPRVFVQFSGVNHYGPHGATPADETTPAGDDYLARLTVEWEAASSLAEAAGVRRIVVRNAVVLDTHGGLFPLMALPVRLYAGGRIGNGEQAVPWIHLADHVAAVRFLIENDAARGVYNLVAPTPTSNEQFMRALARSLGRPFWLPAPAFLLRAVLGEMGVLILEGRYTLPKRLLDLGFRFTYPTIDLALQDLF